MTKNDAIKYVNEFGYTLSDLINMSVDENDNFLIMYGGYSGHHIIFDKNFSNWSLIENFKNNKCIYAKIGKIEHKKFNRDIGIIFFLNKKNTKIESYCLVQNIKNKLHLNKLD